MLELNKQIITILEQLGISKDVFINYQEQNLLGITNALISEEDAGKLLTEFVKQDENVPINFKLLLSKGVSLLRDPFFRNVILTIYRSRLGE